LSTWEETYDFTPGEVQIEQHEGAVQIAVWDQPQVRVKAIWPGEGTIVERLEVQASGNRFFLQVKQRRWGWLGLSRDGLLDLELTVPTGTRSRVCSGSGPVVVTGTLAPVELETGGGSVMLEDVGAVTLETGSGDVLIRRVDGPVEVETGSGRVEVELVRVRSGAAYRIETGSGGVTVAIPTNADLSIDLEAGSGSIDSGGLALTRVHRDDHELEAQLGRGGARLSVETGSGGISLRPYAAPQASTPPQLRQVIQQDAALQTSEQVQRILVMVEQGRLSPDEAEAILRALDEEAGSA